VAYFRIRLIQFGVARRFSTDDYLKNRLVRRAVERNCEIIGEAVRRMTPEFREEHPKIHGSGAVGLRNVIIYDDETIGQIVTTVLPPLLPQLEQLLPPLPEID
jgi:uncharacterized protein with HEPN domain